MSITAACVDPIEILFILGIMFIGGPILFVLSLIPYRNATRALARSRSWTSPSALFAVTLGLTLAWAGVLALTIGSIVHLMDSGGTGVIFCGAFGSLMLLFVMLSNSNQSVKTPETTPSARDVKPQRGPFQIWAQDLIIAFICYGAGLAILSALVGTDRSRMDDFVRWAMYVMLAGSIGLLFAVDFCRRQEWSQTPQKRAMVFVSVFTVFPLILPLAVMAWWRWRRTLELQAKIAHTKQ